MSKEFDLTHDIVECLKLDSEVDVERDKELTELKVNISRNKMMKDRKKTCKCKKCTKKRKNKKVSFNK